MSTAAVVLFDSLKVYYFTFMLSAMWVRHFVQTVGLVMALSTISMSGGMVVPEMQLTPAMKSQDWSKTPLVPIRFTIGVEEMEPLTAQDAIAQNMGSSGSIAFVVRRPG